VRRPPACPLEHAHELAVAVDAAHGFPFLAVFLGGEHRLVDCAKLHFVRFPWLSSLAEQRQESTLPRSGRRALPHWCNTPGRVPRTLSATFRV
jgi:hypothetical protein